MTETLSSKVCRICGKNLAGAKRIKDARGHYYCEPCHAAAVARAPAVPPQPARPSADDAYDFANSPDPSSRPAAPQPAAAPPPTILPKNCPNCGTAMLPGRRLCVRCNRDVTRMDKLLALRADADKPPPKDVIIGTIIGRIIKTVFILVIVGVVAFTSWGVWYMLHPGKPFDEYPVTRANAVREFLGDIAKGTPASYDSAVHLVSFREKAGRSQEEIHLYTIFFTRMHDDFLKKYGPDWLARAQIHPPETMGALSMLHDEETLLEVSIDNDTYHISTQAQIAVNDATIGRLSRNSQSYEEDGKNRFGILDVAEYSVRATRHHIGPALPK